MTHSDNDHPLSDFAESLDTSQSLLNPLGHNDLMDFARSFTDISTEDDECSLPALPNACSEEPSKLQHLDPDEIMSRWIPVRPSSPVPELPRCAKARSPSNVFFETGDGVPTHVPRRTSGKSIAVSAKVA